MFSDSHDNNKRTLNQDVIRLYNQHPLRDETINFTNPIPEINFQMFRQHFIHVTI